jgi:hypothetical protein
VSRPSARARRCHGAEARSAHLRREDGKPRCIRSEGPASAGPGDRKRTGRSET